MDFDTLVAEALTAVGPPSGGVVPAIEPATTFLRDDRYDLVGPHSYRRSGSPTVDGVEQALATIEGGAEALLFGTGMAAFSAILDSLPVGASVVAPRVMYHGGLDLLLRLEERGAIRLHLFESLDLGGLARGVEGGVDLVWLETPINPTWTSIDIAAAASLTHAAGGLIAVDSTVAPPVTTRPLARGADFVFHSATKYLNGHSDVTAGLVVAKEPRGLAGIAERRTELGSVLSPFDAWLLARGVRTLAVRYRRASESAMAVAMALEAHPSVERVLYPGLPSLETHDVAASQMTDGFGGMLALLVADGAGAAKAAATRTRVFKPATSLGGTESLIEHRASIEGPASVVPTNLLRLSVGLESPADLLADMEQALQTVS